MRRSRVIVGLVGTLAACAAMLWAQSACRGECDLAFQSCKNGCVFAQTLDDCTSRCQKEYDRCLEACE